MRKTRRGKLKQQKYLLIGGTFSLLLLLSVGYAAFTTTITLNAKGNVHPNTYTVDRLKSTIGTCGNGEFIADPNEQGRYVYRGADPCNYLTLNNETWRIMSIESDNTLKIIREDSIGDIPFDLGRTSVIAGITENGSDTGTRYSTADFCYSSSNDGCKVWGSKDTMRNSSGVLLKDVSGDGTAKMQRALTDSTAYDLPDDEAYLNIYLNGGTYAGVNVAGWYQTWSNTLSDTVKSYIDDNHLWNVGLVSYTSGQLTATDIAQEKALKWQGRVGLMTASEYVRASTNSSCTGVYGYGTASACYNDGSSHNYLRKTIPQFMLSSQSISNSYSVFGVTPYNLVNIKASTNGGVRPVLYLSSNVKLVGDGTTGSKFQIKTS